MKPAYLARVQHVFSLCMYEGIGTNNSIVVFRGIQLFRNFVSGFQITCFILVILWEALLWSALHDLNSNIRQ